MSAPPTDHAPFVERLRAATNSHDVDQIVECFTADYVNETPQHPARGFHGREQVRRNWTQILRAFPDLSATVLRSTQVAEEVWSEWEMRGSRSDGSDQVMAGVIIFTVTDDQARAARFYLEPVDESAMDVSGAVREAIGDAP
jgi:ketosteroid isomerase-like protein